MFAQISLSDHSICHKALQKPQQNTGPGRTFVLTYNFVAVDTESEESSEEETCADELEIASQYTFTEGGKYPLNSFSCEQD